jgi:Trk-type K+ transport system membrane component
MLKQYSASNRRLFTALIVVIVLWFCTMGAFVWLWNQYDYSTTSTVTTTQSYDLGASNGNAACNSGNGGVNF